MLNFMQKTLIKKEIKSVVRGGRFFMDYLLVPLITGVVLPLIFVGTVIFMEEGPQLEQLMAMLPLEGGNVTTFDLVISVLNDFLPMIFLITPVMVSAAMASGSFIGEKERRTLETLLYSPMSLREIFFAKVVGTFFVSTIVSLITFLVMILVLGAFVFITLNEILIPDITWIAILGLVAPAFSFIGIVFQVRLSAKARNSQEAFQQAGMLVTPLVLLIVTQSMGILVVSTWLLLLVGFGLAVIAWVVLRIAFKKFTYEFLLSKD